MARDLSAGECAASASRLAAYLRLLFGTMRWRVGSVLTLLVCAGLTQGVGLLMLVPLLQAVGLEVGQGSTDRIVERAAAVFSRLGLRMTLGGVLGVYVGLITLQALLARWQQIASEALQTDFVLRLRQRLYRAVAQSEWRVLAQRRSSDLTYALTDELELAGGATAALLALASQAIVSGAHLLLAMHLSVPLSVLALGTGAALLVLLRGRNRLAHRIGEEADRATQALYGAAAEGLAALKTSKSFGVEERDIATFSERSERVAHTEIRAVRMYADTAAWFKVGSVLILSSLLYVGIQVAGLAPAGTLLLLFLFSRLVPKFSALQAEYHFLVSALPAFETVRAAIDGCEAAAEPPSAGDGPAPLREAIRLVNVRFSYSADETTPVLAGIDLCIAAHRTTAIVGVSGAGKSTLADLLAGLLVPDGGRLLVDGRPLTPEQRGAWRRRVGYVPQDTFLFHDTIRENLRWARPSATEEVLTDALRLAAAEDFVLRLPEGLDTTIGDRGVRLSGGERQRIALARALLREPELLILDEATSALDSENESRIRQAIHRLHGRMTIILITHRFSTIRHADTIYVVEGGRLVEAGSWAELVRRGQRFAALCAVQQLAIPSGAIEHHLALP